MRVESKIFRLIDWGFYLVFVPVILLLIPTNRLIDKDPYFLLLMMAYIMVVHIINRRFNFAALVLRRDYHSALVALCVVGVVTYIATRIRVNDLREVSNVSPEVVKEMRHRVIFTLLFIDVCFTVMMALLNELFRQKSEKQAIEAEKGKAELAIYKSQINPHFMFNTLNTIYALNFTQSEKTGEVIMKFSNIVKYIYQNSDKEKIMISEEVKYLQEFIDLHTLRLSELTTVNFTSDVDDMSEYIPSMIFITFVENLFKYGVSSSNKSTIDISITLKNRALTFSTSNTIFSQGDGKSGIGIENCRKRLSLLYPSRHSLECVAEDGVYKTELKIEL